MPSNYNLKFKIQNSSERGVTLIEVLIYILIFSFIMSTALVSVNQILRYSYTSSSKSSIEQEAAFIMAKIQWILNNASFVDASTPHELTADGIKIELISDDIQIDGKVLNSSRTKVSNLNFEKIQISGTITVDTIKTSFDINGKNFESYRTIR